MTVTAATFSRPTGDWDRDGFVGPFPAIGGDAIAEMQAIFLRHFEGEAEPRTMNRHCDTPIVARLACENAVWARLEEILGSDLVLWRSNLFLGNPRLDWHEDRHARLLGDGFAVSALMAIVDGSEANCTLLVPGSHRMSVEEKEQRYGIKADPQSGGNIRYIGQVGPAHFIRMPLAAGECFIFHPQLIHASSGVLGEDAGGKPRASIVLRVTTPHVEVRAAAFEGSPVAAGPILVRGTDRAGVNRYTGFA